MKQLGCSVAEVVSSGTDAGGRGAVRKLRRNMNVTIPIVVLSAAIDQTTVAFLKSDVEGFVNTSAGLESRIVEEVARILGY